MLSLFSTFTMASYQVIIGSPSIQGDSINFVNNTKPVEPEIPPAPVEECPTDFQTSRWVAGSPGFAVFYVIWDGVKLIETGEYSITEKVIGDYKYTKKNQVVNYGDYTFSLVCRIKI